jgi:hypothetical protein
VVGRGNLLAKIKSPIGDFIMLQLKNIRRYKMNTLITEYQKDVVVDSIAILQDAFNSGELLSLTISQHKYKDPAFPNIRTFDYIMKFKSGKEHKLLNVVDATLLATSMRDDIEKELGKYSQEQIEHIEKSNVYFSIDYDAVGKKP